MKFAITVLYMMMVWYQANAAAHNCDLSSDAPNQCIDEKLRVAEDTMVKKTAELHAAVNDRIRDDASAVARFANAVRESEIAWRRHRDANCSIIEAAFHDGSARVNAIAQCELEEAELRIARISRLQSQFGDQPRQDKKYIKQRRKPGAIQ